MKLRGLLGGALVAAVLAQPMAVARADEGMWTFNNVPREAIKKKYGFEVTDKWLEHVRLASVRFNSGGSGSFVSADGLVLTNHHIASDVLSKISTPDHNYFETGFYAKSKPDEVKAPDLELNVLASIEDVTDRVNGAAKDAADAAAANTARRAEISRIEKESLAATGLRSDVVTLYRGGQYHLYRYKKYTDVRLVFAPEFDVAFYGGDPDNFNYPRYDLDMALFRVYENDKPAKIEHFLAWSKTGVKEGELVFVSGNPGSTSRLNTVDHLAFLREVQYPFDLERLDRLRKALHAYGDQGAEQERQAHDDIFGVENSYKVREGEFRGLTNAAVMERKKAAEAALRKAVAADETREKNYGDAWEAITKARASFRPYYVRYRLLEGANGFSSSLFGIARTLVRLAEENEKPNAERLREYTDAGRASLELRLFSPAPVYPGLETVLMTESLALLRDKLGSDDATVKAVLDGKAPAARAAELVNGTELASVDFRKKLAAGGKKAIEESTDPMIVLARGVDAESRSLRKRYEDDVAAVEDVAYGKIARALYEVEGSKLYPDATFTLRLAYGAVRGYDENGKRIRYYTDFAGMYEKSAAAKNADPYHLPERWLEQKSKLDLKTPLNFVSTADTIGGNSGSPLVNTKGELVGLNFDRNSHGLVRNFVYDEVQARNVAVDARGMIEALRSIYHADTLVAELLR